MPYFILERTYAEALDPPIDATLVNEINDEEMVRWIFSYLSLDRKKTYCLYEAPSIEAVRIAAERAGVPAEVIAEVTGRVMPDGRLAATE